MTKRLTKDEVYTRIIDIMHKRSALTRDMICDGLQSEEDAEKIAQRATDIERDVSLLVKDLGYDITLAPRKPPTAQEMSDGLYDYLTKANFSYFMVAGIEPNPRITAKVMLVAGASSARFAEVPLEQALHEVRVSYEDAEKVMKEEAEQEALEAQKKPTIH